MRQSVGQLAGALFAKKLESRPNSRSSVNYLMTEYTKLQERLKNTDTSDPEFDRLSNLYSEIGKC